MNNLRYISIIITFITQASLNYLQEAATILVPQNRIKGRCEIQLDNWIAKEREEKSVKS